MRPLTIFYGLELLSSQMTKWVVSFSESSSPIDHSNSTLVVTAMENTIDFFFIKPYLCHFTMTMVAQLGCTKLIYIHQLTQIFQLVLHLLWIGPLWCPCIMLSWGLFQFHKPTINFLKFLLLVKVGLETPSPKRILEM